MGKVNKNKSIAKDFLLNNLKNQGSVDVDHIYKKAEKEEFLILERQEITETIEHLKGTGDIFEPKPGFIMLF